MTRIPTIDGTEIQLVDQVKYLNVILDKKLNWTINIWITDYKKQASAFGNVEKPMENQGACHLKLSVGFTSQSLDQLFYTLHFCGAISAPAKLNKFRRMAITGAWQSASAVALEAMLNSTLLHILIECEAIKVMRRRNKT